jgi:hypothetical protein
VNLIDLYDPEAEARKKIEKLFLDPSFNESDRHRIITELDRQKYKLGMPLRRSEPSMAEVAALPLPVGKVAIAQLEKKWAQEVKDGTRRHADLVVQLAAMNDAVAWIDAHHELKLERNDCSRLHKLKEAEKANRIIGGDGESLGAHGGHKGVLQAVAQSFVIQHDWHRAFDKAEGLSNEFKLPYEICAFEFRVASRTLIATCLEIEEKNRFALFIESGNFWFPMCGDEEIGKDKADPTAIFIWQQIRAICIALDAEVATSDVIRAPHQLNEKRERQGKLPLLDYRVVNLARRHRIANPSSVGEGGKKRLHFRRGHWRHYETSKTWVRWCLVGNPDLGFIQKHYTL